jgi:hypothetical protein
MELPANRRSKETSGRSPEIKRRQILGLGVVALAVGIISCATIAPPEQ